MSNQMGRPQGKGEQLRVLKSYQGSGNRFTFPALEQVARGDLPPSLSVASSWQPESESGLSQQTGPDQLLNEAREAEARALALERRITALFAEAEETIAARYKAAEEQIEAMLARMTAVLEQAQAEASQKGHAAGYNEGYQNGLEAGVIDGEKIRQTAQEAAEATRKEAHETAEQIQQSARKQREEMLSASKEELLDLAFAIARQILRAELSLRPAALIPMVEAALSKMKGEEEPQLRVGSHVMAVLQEHRGKLMATVPGIRRLSMEEDGALQTGDFMVQGSHGMVDGRIDEQIQVLKDSLRRERS